MVDHNVETIERLNNELATRQATVDALLKAYQTAALPIVPGLKFDVLYRPQAARAAAEANVHDPARYIVEDVLRTPPKHPDDVAVMTIFFE